MSRLVQLVTDLEKIEFTSDRDIEKYAKCVRALAMELHLRVGMDADTVQAILSQYKGRWYTFGVASKIKARLVAAHMRVGAEAVKVLGVSAMKMHAAFRRHFVEPEMEARQAARHRAGSFRIGDDAA